MELPALGSRVTLTGAGPASVWLVTENTRQDSNGVQELVVLRLISDPAPAPKAYAPRGRSILDKPLRPARRRRRSLDSPRPHSRD